MFKSKRTPPRPSQSSAKAKAPQRSFRNLIYLENYISEWEKNEIFNFLGTLYPIWEMRYSKHNPPPENQKQRPLLRPVYWLGNWQFACLNYYHPPKGIYDRCVTAEKYPPVITQLVQKMETLIKDSFDPRDLPRGWNLNTCLINYYGDQVLEDGKRLDCARVGEHKDFEPGPVASISFGEKALFQFVSSKGTETKSQVVLQQWLDDRSLQVFGGDKFKKQLFHRVQRVDRKAGVQYHLNQIDNFETRRINFTFRYVPDEHIVPYYKLKETAQEDVREYMEKLAVHSGFFAGQLTSPQTKTREE